MTSKKKPESKSSSPSPEAGTPVPSTNGYTEVGKKSVPISATFSGISKFSAVWDRANTEFLITAFSFAWMKWRVGWRERESWCCWAGARWFKFLSDIFSLFSSLASCSCASQWGSCWNTYFTRRKINLQEPNSDNRLALKGWTGTCPKRCFTFQFQHQQLLSELVHVETGRMLSWEELLQVKLLM